MKAILVKPNIVSTGVAGMLLHLYEKLNIWSEASYRYSISWEGFLDPSDSYFLFVDFVDIYTH
jgi:hypothetical protein